MRMCNVANKKPQKGREGVGHVPRRGEEHLKMYKSTITKNQKEGSACAAKGILKGKWWPIGIILCLLILSFLIIASDYNHAHGDGGIYARCAKVLYETNRIDITYSSASFIGQLLFSNILCHIFGFHLRVLNISVYIANLLLLIGMYLLLLEMGLSPFLALFGSLTLLVSPISLKMIDWYMTEPFFMFYSVFSLLFFIKGLRRERYLFLYIGSIFGVLAVLTRQHAISLSMALAALCLLYRKEMKRGTMLHCMISAAIPVLAIGLFYMSLFRFNVIHTDVSHAQTISKYLTILKDIRSPINLLIKLYYDALFFLLYVPLYLAPLFITLFAVLIISPKRIRELCTNCAFLGMSLLVVSIGTVSLFLQGDHLMPYLPSIFSIGSLTHVFTITVLKPEQASWLLSIFTGTGAILILTTLSEQAFRNRKRTDHTSGLRLSRSKDRQSKKGVAITHDLGSMFFYFWGIFFMITTIMIGLHYDRYIYPISILMIYVFLSHFPFINDYKTILIPVFILIYAVFIYQIAGSRLFIDLQWRESYALLQEGIPSSKINGGLGFNQYESFDYITDLYKNVTSNRPINWYKFHPLADFFVTGSTGLEEQKKGLVLYRSVTQKKLFGALEGRCFIYKRKNGHKGPIWT